MQITDKDKNVMIKTARSNGAVGRKALLPRFISEIKGLEEHLVLDFGCGKEAIHVQMLREKGFEFVYGTDLEPLDNSNYEYQHDTVLPWHVVYASNVLNVQLSYSVLQHTICKIADFSRYGVAYLSYPKSPRKMVLSTSQMQEILSPFFKATYYFKYRNTVIFKCVGRFCQKKLEERLTVCS